MFAALASPAPIAPPRISPHAPARMSDEALVLGIVEEGHTEWFDVLYRRYSGKVYRKCLSFSRDSDIAADMAQDVLVKVYHQLEKFSAKSKFSTWLYAITYNFCVEYYRKSSRFQFLSLEDNMDPSDDFEDLEPLMSRCRHLHKALDLISPEDKALLLLKYQEDLSIKDLTERFRISDSAIKMRLSRARQRVKELIRESECRAA